jgi:cell division protein FtsI (penicillin-binding protein 3)
LIRVLVSFLAIVLLAAGVVFYLFRIQFVEGEKWRKKAEEMYITYKDIPATRGSIYSAHGDLLATSVPIYRLSIDFKVVRQFHSDSFSNYVDKLAVGLYRIVPDKSVAAYQKLLREGYAEEKQYVTFATRANYIQVKDIRNLPIFRAGRFKGGLIAEERTVRKKPYYGLMARTIGHVNENGVGAGLERSYQEELAGDSGKALYQKIAGGYRPVTDEYEVEPQNGFDLFTTIDINLQDITHNALLNGLKEHDAAWGTAILMEVKTGKIRALANLKKGKEDYYEYYNYAIGEHYEPGSTFKLLSALALLEEGGLKPSDSIDVSGGEVEIYDYTFKDDKKFENTRMSLLEGFSLSSNVYFTKAVHEAFKKDPEDLLEYMEKLHLTKPIGVGMLGEADPLILSPKSPDWNGTTLPSMAIGYSVEVSPLHMAMLYNGIANNGRMMKPYLVEGIGHLGVLEKSFEPQVLEKAMAREEHIKEVQRCLREVAITGTGKYHLKNLSVPCAGKTGTSRLVTGKAGYTKQAYNASFGGYFPEEDPIYTLFVLVNNPKKGQIYGSQVALPIFKEIAVKAYASTLYKEVEGEEFNYPNVHTRKEVLEEVEEWFDEGWTLPDADAASYVMAPAGSKAEKLEPGVMPDFAFMGARDALAFAENRGFKVRIRGVGRVVEQFPEPGKKVQPGQVIYLRLTES